MGLQQYKHKRNFARTPEPVGGPVSDAPEQGLRFVVQKHAASRLHYDFRLEIDGVLKSWAVPKGPSVDPQQRSLAVHVEDHPLEYGDFEGTIPHGEYGGGTVMLWDRGTWLPESDPREQYRRGKLRFKLQGEKLQGDWTLVRMSGRAGEDGKNWLLIKRKDSHALAEGEPDPLDTAPNSVISGRSLKEIAGQSDVPDNIGDAASELTGAAQATGPPAIAPQLPTLVQEPPASEGWLHELKLDGYRIMIILHRGKAKLLTRSGNDWTNRFALIATEAEQLGLSDAVIDGEIVSLRKDGTTDFQALQNAMRHEQSDKLVFFAFDLPWCNGYDLRRTPLLERKELLRSCLAARHEGTRIRFTDHIAGRGGAVFQHACQHSLEGIVSKRADSPYQQGRSRSWVKVKCLHRQEFVVGGYSSPSGARKGFGALLLGHYDEQQKLVYCGRVGTGFTADSLQEVADFLRPRKVETCPFDQPPERDESRDVTWVVPQLVVEVAFAQWTDQGRLRHASFQGVRQDKQPLQVKREQPSTRKSGTYAGVRLSNPDRVLYAESGYTKRDLAAYYSQVADRLLPYLVDRPLTLVRCPRGPAEECFYQKHLSDASISIQDEAGLLSLVQMGALEFHPWGARDDRLDRPDQLVFDLDPDELVDWDEVVGAAHELRELLEALGLMSFVRTTGGKGLHVVVPIARRSPWDQAKQFSRDVADTMVRHDPSRFIAVASKAKRKNKIFIDYLRNARGATAVANYSTRARSGAPVATPLRWEELTSDLQPEHFNIETLESRLRRQQRDPWQGFGITQQSITKAAMQVLRKQSA